MRIRDIPEAIKLSGKIWVYVVSFLVLLSLIERFRTFLGLSREEILEILILISIFIMIILLAIVGNQLSRIERRIERGFKRLEKAITSGFRSLNASNPHGHHHPSEPKEEEEEEEEKEQEIKLTGAGAFGGMIVGGALGLPFGPLGVLIGGILGALIGNQLEYEGIQKKKGKK